MTDDDYEANTSTNWIKVISFVQGGCATDSLLIHLIMNVGIHTIYKIFLPPPPLADSISLSLPSAIFAIP